MGPPSLVSLCIVALLPYADSLEVLYPQRLRLSRSLLAELITPDEPIDPRLWAVLVQIFDGVPDELSVSLEADLADPRIELVHRVRSTSSFELLTVVELPGCRHLTDEVVAKGFRGMHSLAAMDASETTLSAYAMQSLACALEDDECGPWKLSVLFLRNCKSITNDIYAHLSAFPILSVVDLSGTLCSDFVGDSCPFRPSVDDALFHPTPILSILSSVYYSDKFSALHITSFSKPRPPRTSTASASQDSFVVFSTSTSHLQFGNTNTLAFEEEEEKTAPTFKIPVKTPKNLPPRSTSSTFYQPLPKSSRTRPKTIIIPTDLRLARPPPPDPHVALKATQSLHIQLRHQNRALRSNLDPADALAADVNRSSDRAKHAKVALDDVVRRRVEESNIRRRPSQERVTMTTTTRNPFRRSRSGATGPPPPQPRSIIIHQPPGPGSVRSSLEQSSNSNSKPTTTLQTLSVVPPSQPTPVLKPISSLKPPLLPSELSRSSELLKSSFLAPVSASENIRRSSESLHRKRSRAATADSESDGDDDVANKVARPRMMMMISASAGSENLKRPGKEKEKSFLKGGRSSRGNNLKPKQQQQRFDWKAWSRGSGS